MVVSMIPKFLELDSIEVSSSKPLKKFESSYGLELLTDIYSGILPIFVKKPKQQVLENLIEHKHFKMKPLLIILFLIPH